MPTVYRFSNCRVFIYSNDHAPAHVHVICANKEAVFDLLCGERSERKLRDNKGFSKTEVNAIYKELCSVMPTLCKHWSDIHE